MVKSQGIVIHVEVIEQDISFFASHLILEELKLFFGIAMSVAGPTMQAEVLEFFMLEFKKP